MIIEINTHMKFIEKNKRKKILHKVKFIRNTIQK
jgi:hypothetical protein